MVVPTMIEQGTFDELPDCAVEAVVEVDEPLLLTVEEVDLILMSLVQLSDKELAAGNLSRSNELDLLHDKLDGEVFTELGLQWDFWRPITKGRK